jgi:hypothetical protein
MDEFGGAGGGGEEVEMDNGADGIVYIQEYIEFKKDGQTVQLRATSSLLGVPLLSDEIVHHAPAQAVKRVYAAARKADASQPADRVKFTDGDDTRGFPTGIISEPEDLPHPVPDGHADISGQANYSTSGRYGPSTGRHIHSVLLNGPQIALDGVARKRENGTDRDNDEIGIETIEALEKAGYNVSRIHVSRDFFRKYCTVLVWLQVENVVAQALVLYLSERSVPSLLIHTKAGTVTGSARVRLPCALPRSWDVMLREYALTLQSPRGESATEVMTWVCGLFREGTLDWREVEVLEVIKNNSSDDRCTLIVRDPECIERLIGEKWVGRTLNRREENNSGRFDWAKNEIRIKNLPADIEEHETDRQADFLQCLTHSIEAQVGTLNGSIEDKFWFEDSRGYGPSVTAQLATDCVFFHKEDWARLQVRQGELSAG